MYIYLSWYIDILVYPYVYSIYIYTVIYCRIPIIVSIFILYYRFYRSGWWFGTCVIFHNIWNNHPNWLSYFSRWIKPPTRDDLSSFPFLHLPILPMADPRHLWHLVGHARCDPSRALWSLESRRSQMRSGDVNVHIHIYICIYIYMVLIQCVDN